MYIPHYKILPEIIIEYSIPEQRFKTLREIEKEKWLKSTTQYISDLSDKSQKRLLLYLKTLYVLSRENTLIARRVLDYDIDDEVKKKLGEKYSKPVKYKLIFITLTLSAPQIHSDKEIKARLLKDFLNRMQKTWQTYLYVWKAEKQQNGRIHFHIITNRYVPHKWIRQTWNQIQNKLGYIDRFEQLNGHRDPNSTDVHAIYRLKSMGAYFSKYVSKFLENGLDKEVKDILKKLREIDIKITEQGLDSYLAKEKALLLAQLEQYEDRLVDGRIWDASKFLKAIVPYIDVGFPEDQFDKIDFSKMKRVILDFSDERKVVVWYWDWNDQPQLKNFMIDYYAKQLLNLRPDTLFKVL